MLYIGTGTSPVAFSFDRSPSKSHSAVENRTPPKRAFLTPSTCSRTLTSTSRTYVPSIGRSRAQTTQIRRASAANAPFPTAGTKAHRSPPSVRLPPKFRIQSTSPVVFSLFQSQERANAAKHPHRAHAKSNPHPHDNQAPLFATSRPYQFEKRDTTHWVKWTAACAQYRCCGDNDKTGRFHSVIPPDAHMHCRQNLCSISI